MKYYIEKRIDTEDNRTAVALYIHTDRIPDMIVDIIAENTITVFSVDGVMSLSELDDRFIELHLDLELEMNIPDPNRLN